MNWNARASKHGPGVRRAVALEVMHPPSPPLHELSERCRHIISRTGELRSAVEAGRQQIRPKLAAKK
jgi:hypothetical protein